MIKAVIFDCFGVLATEGWIPFRNAHFGNDPEKLRQANELMHVLDSAGMNYDEFIEVTARLANVSPAELQGSLEPNVPEEALFAFIKSLKPQYKVAMLSNAGENQLNRIFTPEHLVLFDALALSCETGYVKPDVAAYQHVARVLGVTPGQCVFTDDQPHYLEGARQAGMQVVQFESADQCIRDIQVVLSRSGE